ncbi:MAG TPA: thiol:disulfide interchange protein DsbG, partial [Pseudorhodoferax sp.]|nr:thiol:disulfide interchange protein DsbG [Pseudorhodoferax sp.]
MNAPRALPHPTSTTAPAGRPVPGARRRLLKAALLGTAAPMLLSPLRASAAEASGTQVWRKLEAATWVRDGREGAGRIVYVITDPGCQWCHRFWEASRPWVQAGKVQVRHVLVGIVRPDSARKAAAILNAQDPAAAIEQNELAFRRGGIFPAPEVGAVVQRALDGNLQLMRELGFRG